VLYQQDGRIGRITLNRPEVMNAINTEMPQALKDAVAEANADPAVHVIVLSGSGRAFCTGYDLSLYIGASDDNSIIQKMPWDPMKDYDFMMKNTECFMSLWRSYKPVICKVHGDALGGGSDIALCSDLIVMADEALIGYMPVRVWGCPTTAMWIYRVGPENAKRMLFTGDKINGKQARQMGLVHEAVPAAELDDAVEALAGRIAGVPQNQLMIQKLMINQALENMGLHSTQMIATLFDGITRHSPEGMMFKRRAEEVGWKQAVKERDTGTFDWTTGKPMKKQGSSA
jgi:enoyl-CoA hydratase